MNTNTDNVTNTSTKPTADVEELAPGVWALQVPFRFLGLLHIGARMTVVRLGADDGHVSGDLVVHSPVPITPEVKRAIDALGFVRFIVAPNLYHHLFVSDATAAWPDAKLLAPARLAKKRPDLRIDAELEAGAPTEWKGAIDVVRLRGTMLGESVLYHRSSKTLVTADLFESFTSPIESGLTRAWLKIGGIYGKPGFHRLMRPLYRDRKAARASIEPLLDLDLERIVISHGNVVTARPKETTREALPFLFA